VGAGSPWLATDCLIFPQGFYFMFFVTCLPNDPSCNIQINVKVHRNLKEQVFEILGFGKLSYN
jgi:hypothetical protein